MVIKTQIERRLLHKYIKGHPRIIGVVLLICKSFKDLLSRICYFPQTRKWRYMNIATQAVIPAEKYLSAYKQGGLFRVAYMLIR